MTQRDTSSSQSDTPRTDAIVCNDKLTSYDFKREMIGLSRQLERELAVLRSCNEKNVAEIVRLGNEHSVPSAKGAGVPVAWIVHADHPFVTMDGPIEGGLPRTPLYLAPSGAGAAKDAEWNQALENAARAVQLELRVFYPHDKNAAKAVLALRRSTEEGKA